MVAYKQERFIREAVEGAFAQTYSPLEIIISDDCSPDRTFDIIKEMAAVYRGPHKIILSRNENSLGLCGNLNKALELTSGELIVGAAGDDISLPHRCERIADEWMRPGRRWHSICSGAEIIDEFGSRRGAYLNPHSYREINSVDQMLESGIVGISGCAHAFSRKTFDLFGAIDPRSFGEHDLLGFRSLILGGVCWIPDRLILYRRHAENLFNDARDIQKMSRANRKQLLEKYYRDCILGERIRDDTLRLAAEKGILAPEKAEYYISALRRSFPMLQFIIVYNRRWNSAVIWMIRAIIAGKYRPGMFSLFEESHLPNWLRRILRFCRKPLMPHRGHV